MILLFAGDVIADESNGAVYISGFLPKGQVNVQVTPIFGADWVDIQPLGNGVQTITLHVAYKPKTTYDEAIADLSLIFGQMSKKLGALIWTQGSRTLSCDMAALTAYEPIYWRGCSIAVAFTFVAGETREILSYLETETGEPLTTESGAFLEL